MCEVVAGCLGVWVVLAEYPPLVDEGAAKELDSGKIKAARGTSINDIAEAAAAQQQQQKEIRKHRLEMMQAYAECRQCRREFLLRYLGDDYTGPCGNCDRCEMAGIRPAKVA